MKSIRLVSTLTISVLGFLLLFPQLGIAAERVVFEARKILTMDPSMPEARFVVVEDGRILSVSNALTELDAWLEGVDYRIDSRFYNFRNDITRFHHCFVT